MYLPDFPDQEERFRELQAEMEELKERILRQVETARRQCAQLARARARRGTPRRRWTIHNAGRPLLR